MRITIPSHQTKENPTIVPMPSPYEDDGDED